MKKSKGWRLALINTILGLLALLWIFPLIFTFYNSVKGQAEYNLGNFWDFPKGFEIVENFQYIQGNGGIFQGMASSFLYAFCGALFAVTLALFAAYALAYLDIKHKLFWFLFIYSGTIFPFQVYLIPIFKGYSKLGLYNTRIGMILFYTAICIPFAMFVLRNFFLGISKEICEAAYVDGATNMQILGHVLVPMAIAPLSVVFLTQFSWCWNELMFGLTFTKTPNLRPIMATLSMLGTQNIPALLLACIIASVPTLLMFSFLQKNIETGFVYTEK